MAVKFNDTKKIVNSFARVFSHYECGSEKVHKHVQFNDVHIILTIL